MSFLLAVELGIDRSAAPDMNTIFEQYAVEIDAALRSRDRVIEPLQKEFYQALGDRERAADIWEEATRKRASVRDINRRYVTLIDSMVGEPAGSDLLTLYEERAYPLAF